MEEYIFCESRSQRISKTVCQRNMENGTCKRNLFKCHQAKQFKAEPQPAFDPKRYKQCGTEAKNVTEAANCVTGDDVILQEEGEN
jgi:hypothetical protein